MLALEVGLAQSAQSILAILAAWGLARAEYLRTKRQALARRRAEIELISKIISEFEAVVRRYAIAASGLIHSDDSQFGRSSPSCHSKLSL
jgi:hypothetical protein